MFLDQKSKRHFVPSMNDKRIHLEKNEAPFKEKGSKNFSGSSRENFGKFLIYLVFKSLILLEVKMVELL